MVPAQAPAGSFPPLRFTKLELLNSGALRAEGLAAPMWRLYRPEAHRIDSAAEGFRFMDMGAVRQK